MKEALGLRGTRERSRRRCDCCRRDFAQKFEASAPIALGVEIRVEHAGDFFLQSLSAMLFRASASRSSMGRGERGFSIALAYHAIADTANVSRRREFRPSRYPNLGSDTRPRAGSSRDRWLCFSNPPRLRSCSRQCRNKAWHRQATFGLVGHRPKRPVLGVLALDTWRRHTRRVLTNERDMQQFNPHSLVGSSQWTRGVTRGPRPGLR